MKVFEHFQEKLIRQVKFLKNIFEFLTYVEYISDVIIVPFCLL